MLSVWKNVIPVQRRALTKGDRICEFHCKKEDVIKNFVRKMPNGVDFVVPRQKPTLKDGTVPCIFPTAPSTSNVHENKGANVAESDTKRQQSK